MKYQLPFSPKPLPERTCRGCPDCQPLSDSQAEDLAGAIDGLTKHQWTCTRCNAEWWAADPKHCPVCYRMNFMERVCSEEDYDRGPTAEDDRINHEDDIKEDMRLFDGR